MLWRQPGGRGRFGRGVAAGAYPVGKEGETGNGSCPGRSVAFHPFSAEVGSPYGVKSVASMPFLTGILAGTLPGDVRNWGADGQRGASRWSTPGTRPERPWPRSAAARSPGASCSHGGGAGRLVRDFESRRATYIKVIGVTTRCWTARCRCGRFWNSWPDGHTALPAGIELVVHRADATQQAMMTASLSHPAGAGACGGAYLRAGPSTGTTGG